MSTPQIANGLASLGRNGDSVLVHMQPQEVAGLQSIAKANGTSLTINPQTGMPEAFNLGNFFESLLPTIAGVGLSAVSGGTLSPLMIGLITGGVTGAATGDMGKGLMAGLGGFGGAGLGTGLQNFGAQTAVPAQQLGQASGVAAAGETAVQNELAQAALANVNQPVASNALGGSGIDFANVNSGMFNPAQTNFNTLQGAGSITPTGPGVRLPMAETSGVMNQANRLSGAEGLSQTGRGFMNAIQNPMDYAQSVGGVGKAAMQVGMPLGMAALSGLDTAPAMGESEEDYRRRKGLGANVWADDYDTGLRLAAGGSITTGGIADIYGTPDGQPSAPLTTDGYGLGRLSNLAASQSMNDAQIGKFAKGGMLESGGFVVPADVVSHLGNGSTDAGLAFLSKKYGAKPIKGNGDGMSDSIKTSIDGVEPAKVADGEAFIPRAAVKKAGGADKLYAMMDKVRTARTGKARQGKQINPNRVA
jgi:hypothetical protein